jgi:hypothetical protein
LGPRGRKGQEGVENLHNEELQDFLLVLKYSFCDEIKQWMDDACGMYVGEGICRQGFGGEKVERHHLQEHKCWDYAMTTKIF